MSVVQFSLEYEGVVASGEVEPDSEFATELKARVASAMGTHPNRLRLVFVDMVQERVTLTLKNPRNPEELVNYLGQWIKSKLLLVSGAFGSIEIVGVVSVNPVLELIATPIPQAITQPAINLGKAALSTTTPPSEEQLVAGLPISTWFLIACGGAVATMVLVSAYCYCSSRRLSAKITTFPQAKPQVRPHDAKATPPPPHQLQPYIRTISHYTQDGAPVTTSHSTFELSDAMCWAEPNPQHVSPIFSMATETQTSSL